MKLNNTTGPKMRRGWITSTRIILNILAATVWLSMSAYATIQNGRILYVTGDVGRQQIGIWDTATGTKTTIPGIMMDYISNPKWFPNGDELVFSGGPGRPSEIYRVRADGTGLRQLTSGGNVFVDPDVFASGTRIAFQWPEGYSYVMNADGSDLTRLSVRLSFLRGSPDGAKLLGSNWGTESYDSDLFVVDLVSGTRTKLATHPEGHAFLRSYWSPDGAYIVVSLLNRSSGTTDLLLMNADGTGLVNLTPDTPDSSESEPTWCSDGDWILYKSNATGNRDIWAMRPDGSNKMNLTQDAESEYFSPEYSPRRNAEGTEGRILFVFGEVGSKQIGVWDTVTGIKSMIPGIMMDYIMTPSWSPYGEWLVFSGGPGHRAEIYKVRPDGTELTQLTFGGNNFVDPDWSPDGTKIAFQRAEGSSYVMNADGSDVTQLPVRLSFVRWSTDGSKLFGSNWGTESYYSDLSTVDIASGRRTKLAVHPAGHAYQFSHPSPDGQRIVVSLLDHSTWTSDLVVMNADGSGIVNLTPDTPNSSESEPTWSADGDWIFFISNITGNRDIWAMRPDGSDKMNVTRNAEAELFPPDFLPAPPRMSIRTSEVEIRWSSVPSATYRVDYRSSLTTNVWIPLFDSIVSTGKVTSVTDRIAVGEPGRFYRVARMSSAQ